MLRNLYHIPVIRRLETNDLITDLVQLLCWETQFSYNGSRQTPPNEQNLVMERSSPLQSISPAPHLLQRIVLQPMAPWQSQAVQLSLHVITLQGLPRWWLTRTWRRQGLLNQVPQDRQLYIPTEGCGVNYFRWNTFKNTPTHIWG